MQAPPIDKRKYGELVAETEELAQTYSQWRPGPQPDAGGALVRIFGRFLELIIARLNRVPEKNFLAFLNLIGTEPLPPQPARVSLTFHTAANGPLDTTVPAGTQVAAPPLEGEEDEVVFETERDLVATRAQLKAVLTRDTETDRYAERSKQASGELDEAFLAFAGDKPMPHELYLACDEVLAQPGEKDVTLIITSADTWQWEWPIEWSYGDGKGWQAKEPGKTEVKQGAWRVPFGKLPPLPPMTVNGVEAGWLRARLAIPLPAAKADLAPESVASGGAAPTDLVLPYYPFGEVPSVAHFYLSADEAFRAGGAVAHLKVTLAQPGKATKTNLRLTWSFQKSKDKSKDDWVELGQSGPGAASSGATGFGFSDSTLAFTQDGEVSFRVPTDWERSLYRNRTGRWIRVDITNEQYSSLPRIGKLAVSYEWRLPSVTRIRLKREGDPLSLLPDLAFFNSATIDLSKDFYPFGEQPRYNDAFYLACQKALARPGATVKVKVTLTNPVGAKDPPPVAAVTTEGGPTIAWEAWNGRAWQELKRETIAKKAQSGTPGTFTANGELDLTLPQTVAPVAVNGEERHWLRARLVGGHFGEAAGYTESTIKVADANIPSYTPKPATYRPPLVKSVELLDIAAGANEVAVSACLGHNDLAYEDHKAAAVAGIDFSPFTVTKDTRPALYLGLDRPFDPRPATIYVQVEPPDPHEVAAERLAEIPPEAHARVTWEYWGAAGWTPLAALDETQTLARPDLVQFIAPEDLKPRPLFGQTLCWLRARWRSGKFPVLPRLRRMLLNTTWASQVSTSRQENLGSSNGKAGQAFQTAQSPVLPGQQLEVREPELPSAAERPALERLEGPDAVTVSLDSAGQPDEVWVRWHQVADFYASRPRDRHYTIDALTGRILFGDGQRGLVPLPGQNNIRLTYRTGGGAQGNRAAGSIVQLKSTVPYIEGASNPEPASGGAPLEPIERVAARGPCWLRHRDRSVTAQDLEDLAFDADPSVARARAILPSFDPLGLWLDPAAKAPDLSRHEKADAGRMGVVLVPRGDAKRPVASLGLLRRVKGHLASRSPVTADLWVAGPEWVEVTVAATVVPTSLAVADAVLSRVTAALDGFLHPLTGGPQGQGWPFARIPHASDLYAVIEAVAGVDHVRVLEVSNEPQIEVKQAEDESLMNALRKRLNQPLEKAVGQTPDPAVERWLGRSLVYSGRHHIRLALEAG